LFALIVISRYALNVFLILENNMSDYPEGHVGNWHGKVFAGNVSDVVKPGRERGNQLYDGADIEALRRVQERIADLVREGELPSSYTVHSSVQLLPDRVFDTSNRATVLQAQKNGFDPEGFRQGRPLEKGVFYLNPFVTCAWCNMISFVDVMTVRRMMHMSREVSDELHLPLESLPPCRQCGKADHLRVGSLDFTEEIANREKVARELLARQVKACRAIQRTFRSYLRRMYAHAASKARQALAKLQHKAATAINKTARLRFAVRRVHAERNLREIKNAHPVLLAYALKAPTKVKSNKKGEPVEKVVVKTFWFSRQLEVDMCFRDYLGLSERMGYNPSRKQMEVNFAEIARRIIARKNELLVLVQRGWRGVMARRTVKYFRTEIIRLEQFVISKILKIQRAYRGHRARLSIPKLLHSRRREAFMSKYLNYSQDKLRLKTKADTLIKVKSAYIKERSEERTARFTGRIDVPTDHDDRKMRAFANSVYSDQRLPTQVNALLSQELSEIRELKKSVEEDRKRKDFLLARIEEHGPAGYGNRGFKPKVELSVVNGFLVGPEPISSRSKGMRILMKDEVKEIMQGVIERATHDFRGNNLLERFKVYTGERIPKVSVEPSKSSDSHIGKSGVFGKPEGKAMQGKVATTEMATAAATRHFRDGMERVSEDKKLKKRGTFRREYKFPDDINVNKLAFLDEDMESAMAFADKKRKQALQAAEEADAASNTLRKKKNKDNMKKSMFGDDEPIHLRDGL